MKSCKSWFYRSICEESENNADESDNDEAIIVRNEDDWQKSRHFVMNQACSQKKILGCEAKRDQGVKNKKVKKDVSLNSNRFLDRKK